MNKLFIGMDVSQKDVKVYILDQDGDEAINLEMPSRVPRTEYSVDSHWKLVQAVTGIDISPDSSVDMQWKARNAFTKAWNYDFIWHIDIVDCGVNGFVLESITDMKYIADKYGKTHVFIGNANTRVLLNGSREDIYNEVKRCMDIGKKCSGFFMAIGNHITSNISVENALYYNEVYEKLGRR